MTRSTYSYSSTYGSTRGMTLLEAVIAVGIFSIVMAVAFAGFKASAETASVTNAMTDAQVVAENLQRELRRHLSLASSGSAGGGSAEPVVSGVAGSAMQIAFTPIKPDRPLYDPLDPPADPLQIQWEPRCELRFEADGAEVLDNDVDDDGDLLVDEGKVARYVGGSHVDDLARDVSAFTVSYNPTANPLPWIRISVTVQRVIPGAIRKTADLTTPPVTTHTAVAVIPLLN